MKRGTLLMSTAYMALLCACGGADDPYLPAGQPTPPVGQQGQCPTAPTTNAGIQGQVAIDNMNHTGLRIFLPNVQVTMVLAIGATAATSATQSPSLCTITAETVTDAEGRYQFRLDRPGFVQLTVHHASYEHHMPGVLVGPGAFVDQDLVLAGGF